MTYSVERQVTPCPLTNVPSPLSNECPQVPISNPKRLNDLFSRKASDPVPPLANVPESLSNECPQGPLGSNAKRLKDLFNGKDCEVGANVTLVGVGGEYDPRPLLSGSF